MGDTGYFVCLGVTAISAVTAVVAARSVIFTNGACGSAITLAVSSCAGFICALPFGHTREMPWLPLVSAAVFGSIMFSAILCCLVQIKAHCRPKQE